MFINVLSRIERDAVMKPQRVILLLRINAILIGLCAAFMAALVVGVFWSGLGSRTRLTAHDTILTLMLLACAIVMLASLNGIWRGDLNAMVVAWIAFALTGVLKALSLTLTLGFGPQIDGVALVLAITGMITMRAMLARGLELSTVMKDAALRGT